MAWDCRFESSEIVVGHWCKPFCVFLLIVNFLPVAWRCFNVFDGLCFAVLGIARCTETR